VVEWQKRTEMPHYHVLFNSDFIPYTELDRVWGFNRPANAGPKPANRPAFGTVHFSRGTGTKGGPFTDAKHAACYATKYLIKHPDQGYPGWVLDQGKKIRIKRYDRSRGFFKNRPSKPKALVSETQDREFRTYRERNQDCCNGLNLLEYQHKVDVDTGEIAPRPQWRKQYGLAAKPVLNQLFDPGNPKRLRRSLLAQNQKETEACIITASHAASHGRNGPTGGGQSDATAM
jgi:hypothetical protein